MRTSTSTGTATGRLVRSPSSPCGKVFRCNTGPPVSASKERNGGIFTFKAVLTRAQKAAQRGKEAAGTQNWQAGISVAGSLETYRPHNAGANIVMQP